MKALFWVAIIAYAWLLTCGLAMTFEVLACPTILTMTLLACVISIVITCLDLPNEWVGVFLTCCGVASYLAEPQVWNHALGTWLAYGAPAGVIAAVCAVLYIRKL